MRGNRWWLLRLGSCRSGLTCGGGAEWYASRCEAMERSKAQWRRANWNRRAEPPSSGDCGQVLAQLPGVSWEAKVDSQVAAPAETRTPNWHRANHRSDKSADGRMAAEADRFDEDHSTSRGNYKTDLTLTGLLMERVGSHVVVMFLDELDKRKALPLP